MRAASARNRARPTAGLSIEAASAPLRQDPAALGAGIKACIVTRGCQANVADSEVVRALLQAASYELVDENDADVLLINSCAIRDKAEEKVWQWLREKRSHDRKAGRPRRIIALLGCMAERLKVAILEDPARLADVVVGPDAYRDLPGLLSAVCNGDPGAVGYNVQLSQEESYADISPVREHGDKRCAYVSIQRSCPMSCAFWYACRAPLTRRSCHVVVVYDCDFVRYCC
jgi:tRNA-2-methylthio-N6-dimethylallyladenosine synthase